MNRLLIILLIILLNGILGVSVSYMYFDMKHISFEDLNPQEMHEQIVENREIAIDLARQRGEYKCCINPDCTMCYDSANKWNYGQAGKCFCDEFIARGEEPCPQCEKVLECDSGTIHGDESEAFCDIKLESI